MSTKQVKNLQTEVANLEEQLKNCQEWQSLELKPPTDEQLTRSNEQFLARNTDLEEQLKVVREQNERWVRENASLLKQLEECQSSEPKAKAEVQEQLQEFKQLLINRATEINDLDKENAHLKDSINKYDEALDKFRNVVTEAIQSIR